MSQLVQHTISAAAVPLTAVASSKAMTYIADATNALPAWVAPFVGPVGALVGTLIAIKWLLARLDKAEKKADARELERDKNMTLLATLTVQSQTIIEQNSQVLEDVKKAIQSK
jgi:ABC-type enterochelin transport system ATPase subunit